MDSENSYVVVIGGTTVSVFILFFIAVIIHGLRYLMDIIVPVVIGLMVIEIIVEVIFIITTILSNDHTMSRKIANSIVSLLPTGISLYTTYMLKETFAAYVCRNPSIGDIISFAFAFLFVGGISFFCICGWLMTLCSLNDDSPSSLIGSLLLHLIPFFILVWSWS